MFDLDKSIHDWRARMTREGLRDRDLLDELESHLREDIARQTQAGADFQSAIDSSVDRIGPATAIKSEFRKVAMKTLNLPLVYFTWAIYVISYFVPAFMEGWGWQCAILQKTFWDGAMRGEWGAINYELLTLCNVLMLASPLFLFLGGSMKWFRILTLAAVILVWVFLGMLLHDSAKEIKVGAYMWGASFILLHLSSYKLPSCKPVYA